VLIIGWAYMDEKSSDGAFRAKAFANRILEEEMVGESLAKSTVYLYLRKLEQIAKRSSIGGYWKLTPEIIVRDFTKRVESKAITQATARLEKAVALFWIAAEGRSAYDSNSSELWRFECAYNDIISTPIGELSVNSKNTSSKKAKAFPDEVFDMLMNEAFTSGSESLLDSLIFIRVNLFLGLRPVEWLNARIINYQHRNALGEHIFQPDGSAKISPALEVLNAKHSTVRGNGHMRIILLDSIDDEGIRYIQQWIGLISKLKTDRLMSLSEEEIYKKIYGSMQRTIRRVLIKAGWQGQKPTLYSTRHQAVANARADGLTEKEIAALFGHSSTNTARRHYGKKIAGYSGRTMRPAPESIWAVRSTVAVRPKPPRGEPSPALG